MVERLFNLLSYCGSDINQYPRQKTLGDVFGASLLVLELSCFTNIALPYH